MKPNIFINFIKDCWHVFCLEIYRIFSDKGVVIIFFLAGLVYPLLYGYIYHRENLCDVPVAVVDLDQSADSRRFINKMDATPDIKVSYHCGSLQEASQLFKTHKVRGIVYFPSDYSLKLSHLEQATLSLYCDMSSFLYYRAVYMGANYVMINEMKDIAIKRYNALGMVDESALRMVEGVQNEQITLFSPSDGFSSFLLPAIMILIIHQTLFFGICMMCGTAYEEGNLHIPERFKGRNIYRVVVGRSFAYFVIYYALAMYALVLVPRIFNLPHVGNLGNLMLFMVPFLQASIFFSFSVGSLIRNREISLLLFAPFTIILLFLSGFSWPTCNMPWFWRVFAWIFPSTFGIQGYIAVNSMGATLSQIQPQWVALWIQVGLYFITSCVSLRLVKRRL